MVMGKLDWHLIKEYWKEESCDEIFKNFMKSLIKCKYEGLGVIENIQWHRCEWYKIMVTFPLHRTWKHGQKEQGQVMAGGDFASLPGLENFRWRHSLQIANHHNHSKNH